MNAGRKKRTNNTASNTTQVLSPILDPSISNNHKSRKPYIFKIKIQDYFPDLLVVLNKLKALSDNYTMLIKTDHTITIDNVININTNIVNLTLNCNYFNFFECPKDVIINFRPSDFISHFSITEGIITIKSEDGIKVSIKVNIPSVKNGITKCLRQLNINMNNIVEREKVSIPKIDDFIDISSIELRENCKELLKHGCKNIELHIDNTSNEYIIIGRNDGISIAKCNSNNTKKIDSKLKFIPNIKYESFMLEELQMHCNGMNETIKLILLEDRMVVYDVIRDEKLGYYYITTSSKYE